MVVSCAQNETWKEEILLSASHVNQKSVVENSNIPISHPVRELRTSKSNSPSEIESLRTTKTPIPSILGTAYDASLDLHAGPIPLPIKIIIPILDVDAPILGVGLTEDNNMDAPKGLYGDPNWSSTFWYRGSAVPGDIGTVTMAGHVNGPGGEPETFARIRKLKPGDLIIIKVENTETAFYYVVDEVKKYSLLELIEPEISTRIFGGSIGTEGNRLTDGLSHLTLITCTGNYADGEFDHRIVVFSTLRD